MFDTISGLPVHMLVVHAVVVLLPLMSIVTAAVAVRRSWRQYAPAVVVVDAVVVVLALAAKESGEHLQARLQTLGNPSWRTTTACRGPGCPTSRSACSWPPFSCG